MKAKLRKAQKEKLKKSLSNQQKSLNESKSQSQTQVQIIQENNNNNILNIEDTTDNEITIENNKNVINPEKEIEEVKTLKQDLNPNKKRLENNINKIQINTEEYKEQELPKIATMFKFEIDKEKKIINIKENEEYYDLRKQII